MWSAGVLVCLSWGKGLLRPSAVAPRAIVVNSEIGSVFLVKIL